MAPKAWSHRAGSLGNTRLPYVYHEGKMLYPPRNRPSGQPGAEISTLHLSFTTDLHSLSITYLLTMPRQWTNEKCRLGSAIQQLEPAGTQPPSARRN